MNPCAVDTKKLWCSGREKTWPYGVTEDSQDVVPCWCAVLVRREGAVDVDQKSCGRRVFKLCGVKPGSLVGEEASSTERANEESEREECFV